MMPHACLVMLLRLKEYYVDFVSIGGTRIYRYYGDKIGIMSILGFQCSKRLDINLDKTPNWCYVTRHTFVRCLLF